MWNHTNNFLIFAGPVGDSNSSQAAAAKFQKSVVVYALTVVVVN